MEHTTSQEQMLARKEEDRQPAEWEREQLLKRFEYEGVKHRSINDEKNRTKASARRATKRHRKNKLAKASRKRNR